MTITDTDTITADAELAELTAAEALRELAEENADLRDQLADSRRSTALCIRVLDRLVTQLYPDDITASDGETAPAGDAGT